MFRSFMGVSFIAGDKAIQKIPHPDFFTFHSVLAQDPMLYSMHIQISCNPTLSNNVPLTFN